MSDQPVTNPRAIQDGAMVAHARILDAISWLMKAHAQFGVCNGVPGDIQLAIEACIERTWNLRVKIAQGGNSDEKLDPHRIMVAHALMNAAGHAEYAGQHEYADTLAHSAMEVWQQQWR